MLHMQFGLLHFGDPASTRMVAVNISSGGITRWFCGVFLLLSFSSLKADETSSTKGQDTYLLRYKLKKDDVLRSEVTHLAKTYTKVSDVEDDSESRTISMKRWEVTDVNDEGHMTFVYSLESVNLSQKIGQGEEITYNSDKDAEAPNLYTKTAADVGRPLSTVTIDPLGAVVNRDEQLKTPNLGMGDITIVFPEKPVAVGESWDVSREFRARLEDGGQKVIKIRERYTLKKVQTGIATFTVRAQPLTPYNDPKIESQVVQQLSNGEIKFDLDSGRQISKELKWDDSVIGFAGAQSLMEYSARYDEALITEPARTALR